MYLIQLFLPLYDNQGTGFERTLFEQVRDELLDRFGGLTQFSRAPAKGLWEEDQAAPVRDDLIIYEVLCERIDRNWWQTYRSTLEHRFRQDRILIRAQAVDLL